MIPIGKPSIGDQEKEAVLRVLDSGMLANGTQVREFEENFAKFIGVKHAIATSNGTTALHAALIAHGIGSDDEVITTPFSFIATANSIKLSGATPIFVDIDEASMNIDPALIKAAITQRTKAIMPVHIFGQPAAMQEIQQIANDHNLIIIEDACQAHGAHTDNQKVGSFGTGCFSFYPTKNMTTGEGGIITTNDDEVAKKVKLWIDHGSEKRYHHLTLGHNFRMTNIAAAIGSEQLKKLPQFTCQRQNNAVLLNTLLQGTSGIILPKLDPGHVFHQYTIRITEKFPINRNELITKLKEAGIGSSIFYPVPIHKQVAYQEYNNLDLPISQMIASQVLSLPVHPDVSQEDIKKIARVIEQIQ
jgi:perosamine synthetase